MVPDGVELREFLSGRREYRTAVRFEPVEMRSDGVMQLRGYAAMFDSLSDPIWGMFVERIARGAFRKALAADPDVVLNFNHGGLPMARTTNGSLRLKEDQTGLAIEADLADTTHARDIHTLVERGDLSTMSFAFTVAEDKWLREADEADGLDLRTILSFRDLFDVSVVTTPAYPDTTVETKSRSTEPDEQQAGGGSGEQPTQRGASEPDPPTLDPSVSANQARIAAIRARRARITRRSTHDEPRPEGAEGSSPHPH